jgi:hypothetical protein
LWFAYDLQPYQIVNMPDWLDTDRFTVAAKAPDDAPGDQIKVMVQSLLEDRFKLIAHLVGTSVVRSLTRRICRPPQPRWKNSSASSWNRAEDLSKYS